MNVTTLAGGEPQIIQVGESRIDAAVAIQFKDRVRELVSPEAERVVLDLAAVEFIDSSGLGAIVAAMKAMGEGQRLDLAGLTPIVDKVFRMTRMDTIFVIHESLDAARAAKVG
ncbi:STAS domain-containing protein [Salipiger sp.]|uniref:STAS domain-containing protein n=1 Tax=Salipiger sp. TaxID=2078585 RepID=UPI003A970F65